RARRAGRPAQAREDRRTSDRRAAVRERYARARPAHPNQRRDADLELLALGGRVLRALVHAGVLAGLRSRAAVRSDPRLPETRTSVRRDRRRRLSPISDPGTPGRTNRG